MKLELDLEVINRLGIKREAENFAFRAFLKGQEIDEVDEIVHRLHDEIVPQIDCTECGNCCNNLIPGVTQEEIRRLSGINGIPVKEFEKKFVELSDDNEKFLKHTPCKYLVDKKCSIYQDRPEECRSYPHTHKDEFIFRLFGIIHNYKICPIVFNLYEQLKIEFGFRS